MKCFSTIPSAAVTKASWSISKLCLHRKAGVVWTCPSFSDLQPTQTLKAHPEPCWGSHWHLCHPLFGHSSKPQRFSSPRGRKGRIAMVGAGWHTVPLPAGWPPGHFPSAQPRPARSTRCRQPAQPGGRGTPSLPRSASRHRECPASAGHLSRGEYWYSAPLTHTHTWGSQSSHPQTCRSHPAGDKGEESTNKVVRSSMGPGWMRYGEIQPNIHTPQDHSQAAH